MDVALFVTASVLTKKRRIKRLSSLDYHVQNTCITQIKKYILKKKKNTPKNKIRVERRKKTPVLFVLFGVRALKAEVEKEASVPTYTAEDLGLTPLAKRDKLRKGDKVVVCTGSQIGLEGEVASVRTPDTVLSSLAIEFKVVTQHSHVIQYFVKCMYVCVYLYLLNCT